MSRVTEARAQILEWHPINKYAARERLLGLGFPAKDVSRANLPKGGKHGKNRPALWGNEGDMIVPLPAGGGSPSGGSSNGVRPSSVAPVPPAVAEPIPSLKTPEDRLLETAEGLGEKNPGVFARFMGSFNVGDQANFEAGLAAYPQMSSAMKSMVSVVWGTENGWSSPAAVVAGAVGTGAAVAVQKWVAFRGDLLPADPADPGAVDLSVAVAQATLQQGKMAMAQGPAAPAPPDLQESLAGIGQLLTGAAGDALRRFFGPDQPRIAGEVSESAAVRLAEIEEAKLRRESLLQMGKQVGGMLVDLTNAFRQTRPGELREKVLSMGHGPVDQSLVEETCSSCQRILQFEPDEIDDLDCPNCGAHRGTDGLWIGMGATFPEVYGEETEGPAAVGFGEGASFNSESGAPEGSGARVAAV